MVPNIDPEQVRKLAGWGLTQNDRASFVGWSQSSLSAGVFHRFMTIGVGAIKNGVEQGHGQLPSGTGGMKDCGQRQADSGRIKPGSETVNNPDPDSFRAQIQRLRTQNPQQTRPQPPVERGWADKADSRPPLRGPGGWGAIGGCSGMPLTASGRERPPHSDACKKFLWSWAS